LPAGFAAALVDDGRSPVPRESASVLVLDGTATPWRVLMMRRPGGADFAPGAWVFPGGSTGVEDATQPDPNRGAAVRELWEELGLLVAWRTRDARRRFATTVDSARVREAVESGLGFWPALAELALTAAPERLVPLTRWITPVGVRRRFDTRFYAMRSPRQQVVPRSGEVSGWRWLKAVEALALGDGELV
jgi:8-oxo-dGTP pyrophosphatase MutT (NUDIX family)